MNQCKNVISRTNLHNKIVNIYSNVHYILYCRAYPCCQLYCKETVLKPANSLVETIDTKSFVNCTIGISNDIQSRYQIVTLSSQKDFFVKS